MQTKNRQAAKTPRPNLSQRVGKKTKFSAQSTRIDGIYFPSKAEGARYEQLRARVEAGEIQDLKTHPRFTIWQHGEEKIVYEADFQYRQGDRVVVEDVKGVQTEVYKLKKKMFLALFPHLQFYEIKRGKAIQQNT